MTEEFTWGGEVYTYNPTQSWESVIFLDFALGFPLIIAGGLVWTPFILVVAAGFLTWLISFKFVEDVIMDFSSSGYSILITLMWLVKNDFSFTPGN